MRPRDRAFERNRSSALLAKSIPKRDLDVPFGLVFDFYTRSCPRFAAYNRAVTK
jgi:hypothetical protein